MYWKFDKEFGLLLPSLATRGTCRGPRTARRELHDVIPSRKVGLLCEGARAIFHSDEIKLSRSTAGNYDVAVRLTRSRTARVSHFFPQSVSAAVDRPRCAPMCPIFNPRRGETRLSCENFPLYVP